MEIHTPKNKPFTISTVCREDLLGITNHVTDEHLFKVDDVMALSDGDMERLASKLGDDYCEQLFWGSLAILGEHIIEQSKTAPATPATPAELIEMLDRLYAFMAENMPDLEIVDELE